MNVLSENLQYQSVVNNLSQGWTDFEKELMQVALHPDFLGFLRQYRGIDTERTEFAGRSDLVLAVTQSTRELITAALSAAWHSPRPEPRPDFDKLLRVCEGAFNLALYFWHAPNERNFQFRTVIHFLNIPSDPLLISLTQLPQFFLRMTEWGIQLSTVDSFEPFPFRYSLERACDLSALRWERNTDDHEVAQTIARLRVIQREFCQLIDEWEHCNSILAVRQFGLRKLPAEQQHQAQKVFAEISRSRDLLALWCTGSATNLQRHVSNGLLCSQLHSDVKAELVAIDALLLSGFQKFFLPASVSRHIYGQDVIREFERFTVERLSAEPDDMYALISNAVFSIALGKSPEWQSIISNLESKSFHWSLSADPTSAVKAVAWSFSRAEHHLLTVILILTLHAKREPSRLDSYWLQALASVAEMPSTFGRETPAREFNAVNRESLSGLIQRALTSLSHFESETHEEHVSAYRYIVEFLESDVSE